MQCKKETTKETIMIWDEMSDKDKTKMILDHVYGYYFVESEQYVDQHREKLPADFHWPIAWYDELHEAWGTRDISSNWNTFFDPLHNMNDAWQIVENMVSRMGYLNLGFEWRGPLFKPEHHYLTNEGYPLGTTCWYVFLECNGMRYTICAKTAQNAICMAALKAAAELKINDEKAKEQQ